jgi:hypothetical protein
VILATGAGFGALGTVVDARTRRGARRAEHDRLALLAGRGYALGEAHLAFALPRLPGEDAPPPLDLWRRADRAFLGGPGALRPGDERWSALAAAEARAPLGPAVLLELETTGGSRRARNPTNLRLTTLRPGTEPPCHTATLAANGDGLFEVTGLVAG